MSNVIKAKVTELMQNSMMFTSVNVGNAVKSDGTWISNREVAKWLRQNFSDLNDDLDTDYIATQISVNGSSSANLYHHFSADPDNYTDRLLKAITPVEFKAKHGKDPFTLPTTTKSMTKSIMNMTNKLPIAAYTKRCIREFKRGRIRIPGALTRAVGLKPGDTIDVSKLVLNKTNLSDKLKVHNDGRVNIPRKCLDFKGKKDKGQSVEIFVKDNLIGFNVV